MEEREARRKLIEAFLSSPYKWRTPRGVAKDSGVPYQQTYDLLLKSGDFVKSRKASSSGEPLFMLAAKYLKEEPLIARIFATAANTISSSSEG